jgi:hypothetical protein
MAAETSYLVAEVKDRERKVAVLFSKAQEEIKEV